MKQLRAAKHPVSLWAPLGFLIGSMSLIVEIFSGLSSMSRLETMKPRSFPSGTPKTHFSRLSLMWLAQILEKVSSRLVINHVATRVFTMMLSTYISKLWPICSWKHFCIHR